MTGNGSRRPNICFILTDQERHRGWLPDDVDLPARRRLLERGQEFDRHYTHTSPCSPSRATLVTGQYMPAHGIKENTRGPANGRLDIGVDTLGKMLRREGYYTGYKGKWHLSMGPYPDMESYGFGDWEGNDQAFWGQAGSGVEFDEPIAASAAQWIHNRADERRWLRQLDYYVKLHEMSDASVGLILDAIDEAGATEDTVVVFTSDHGDQCGSHALRSKGPWNYEETMRIPLYVAAPGLTTPGTRSEALTSHVDLTVTVAEMAGVDLSEADLPGRSLAPPHGQPCGRGPQRDPVRAGLGLVRRPAEHAVRQPGRLRRPLQVLPLLRGGRQQHDVGPAAAPPAPHPGRRASATRPRWRGGRTAA